MGQQQGKPGGPPGGAPGAPGHMGPYPGLPPPPPGQIMADGSSGQGSKPVSRIKGLKPRQV